MNSLVAVEHDKTGCGSDTRERSRVFVLDSGSIGKRSSASSKGAVVAYV